MAGKRVLILVGCQAAGAGHVRAADALMKDFLVHPDVEAQGGEVQALGDFSEIYVGGVSDDLFEGVSGSRSIVRYMGVGDMAYKCDG